MINKANKFIKENKDKVNKEFLQKFHLMPPIGWMNDPNGFSRYKDEYHLFYQCYPYEEKWNSMHWGHAVTKDFIKWEDKPVALAPDENYDDLGCFSGTAIEHKGELVLMYTGINKRLGKDFQEQAIARSSDGINFTKSKNNPVIPVDKLPEGILQGEFRDPKLWEKDGKFYTAVVAMDEKFGGRMPLFASEDLENWEYVNDFIDPIPGFGTMWECPDIFDLDNNLLIMMSIILLEKEGSFFTNKQSAVYALGKQNNYNQTLGKEDFHEIDCGFDFYAPQTVLTDDGRRIMTAWMQAWEDEIISSNLKQGWAGCMTLPREITIENNRLIQNPVREIENYRKNLVHYNNVEITAEEFELTDINGSAIEIEMDVDLAKANYFIVNMFKSKDNETVLSYDKQKETITFDRRNSGHEIKQIDFKKENYRTLPLELEDNILNIRIFIDTSSVEVFLQKGEMTITSRIYPIDKDYGISFKADGRAVIKNINKWSIG